MAKRHVIVGAGTAGINCIRTLRQQGNTDEIALVSAEPPYSRMVLPYYLEQGISEAHATTATANQLEAWKVQAHIGRRAEKLDTKKNTLTLDNGDELTYDDLLIATGSRAARPPIPGAEGEGIHSFWTLAQAKGVHAEIGPASHVVLVGAGFIAFTILNGIIARAGKVTIIEVADRILPRMVDAPAAAIVTQWLQDKGLTIHTGTKLKSITQQGGKRRLELDGAPTIDADLVIMATGIHTNLEWLKGSGIEMDQGILVDGQQRSNVPNVYAAGDVAQGRNLVTGKQEVHAIEPTAMEHGRIVGANMAGQAAAYAGSLIINIVGVAGLDMASFGTWDNSKADVITGESTARHAYRKYLFEDGVLTGAIYVGTDAETWAGNDLGMMKGLVHAGARLGDWTDYLRAHPFDIKKPYLAAKTVGALLPKTTLGQPSASPRG